MASVIAGRATKTLQARLCLAAARYQHNQAVENNQQLLSGTPKLTKLPNGVTVASIENYSPLSRVALVANAGSRFEDGDNLGVTHCLRVASGLSTQNSTAFGITRNLEQVGANFTCSSTREYVFYKTDCLRDNLDLMTKTLLEATTAPAFKPWELSDLTARLRLELAVLKSQPSIMVYDLLHQAAFRDTLGRSLYAPDFMLGKYSSEQLLHFMKAYYSSGRVALVGVGVDHDQLVEQANQFTPFSSADIAHDKAKYSGGELRMDTGGDLTYVAVAVEGPSLEGKDLLNAAVLQNVMGMGPSIKYSSGSASSPLTKAVEQTTSQPFAVSCINANYTDSGLFGFYIIAKPTVVEKVMHAAYRQFLDISKGGLEEKEVANAKKKLKSQISMYRESGEALIHDLGEQALGSDELLTTTDLFKFVDSINTADVKNLAKKLAESKPSMAAVGNLSHTPYVDSLFH